jgi:hypothetical protein
MHLNAAIALQGLADAAVDDVVDRIRRMLQNIAPDLDVAVAVQSVGFEFGAKPEPDTFGNLLAVAEQRRRDLLGQFWRHRQQDVLMASQRLGHVMMTMNMTRIRLAMEATDVLSGL